MGPLNSKNGGDQEDSASGRHTNMGPIHTGPTQDPESLPPMHPGEPPVEAPHPTARALPLGMGPSQRPRLQTPSPEDPIYLPNTMRNPPHPLDPVAERRPPIQEENPAHPMEPVYLEILPELMAPGRISSAMNHFPPLSLPRPLRSLRSPPPQEARPGSPRLPLPRRPRHLSLQMRNTDPPPSPPRRPLLHSQESENLGGPEALQALLVQQVLQALHQSQKRTEKLLFLLIFLLIFLIILAMLYIVIKQ